MWNKRAKIRGPRDLHARVVCVSTGLFMTFRGATLNNRRDLARARRLGPAGARRVHPPPARAHPPAAVPAALRLGRRRRRLPRRDGVSSRSSRSRPKRIVNVNGDTVFFPSSSETFDQGLLDGKKLAANEYCQECHPDSFHQWERSAHRFSSFNNPFYRKSVELMADRVGRERTKWCSGCHDPVVLFTGQMGAATQATFSYDSWEAQQGLTCMSCHSIAEVKDVQRQRLLRHRGVQAVSVRVLEERDARARSTGS